MAKQQIKKDIAASEPGEHETAILAYQLWLDRGCPEGSSEEDWFRAEQTLRATSESSARSAVEPRVMRAV